MRRYKLSTLRRCLIATLRLLHRARTKNKDGKFTQSKDLDLQFFKSPLGHIVMKFSNVASDIHLCALGINSNHPHFLLNLDVCVIEAM